MKQISKRKRIYQELSPENNKKNDTKQKISV